MNSILKEAYVKIKHVEPDTSLADWELAEAIVNDFNVPVLGEDFSKQVIFTIVNGAIEYPDQETTTRIVGRAEGFASELFEGLSDEPHMAELEREENKDLYKKDRGGMK